MKADKTLRYLGFAKKAGSLVSGVNTCGFNIKKGKVFLVILAEDISENSEKKIMKEIRKGNVPWVKYGTAEELSHATGAEGRSVFAITDRQFSQTIYQEIQRENNKEDV